jgi:secreted PhoX family phosphatase
LTAGLWLGTATTLLARRAAGFADEVGYGSLAPAIDLETGLPLLKLPEGFRYRSFGWTGDPMADGAPTPDLHDGMGVVQTLDRRGHSYVLVRNHERGAGTAIGGPSTPTYDRFAAAPVILGFGGGTTALVVTRGALERTVPTLAGTLVNCAGGVTPWGSWLTCEEIQVRGARVGARDHGFVFEVPSPLLGASSAAPIVAMGFMKHEAVAVDPRSGFVYLTEDNGPSGLFRFRPHDASRRLGALEQGGSLEMLKVEGADNVDLGAAAQGVEHDVEWVAIAEPDADPERFGSLLPGLPPIFGAGKSGPYLQGEARGAAAFRRLEGCWYDAGRVYFTDTTGGAAAAGALWALDPVAGTLRCVFASPGELHADHLDNLCFSPRGGIVLCEDGGGIRNAAGLASGNRLLGLTSDGSAYRFAENNIVLDAALERRPWIAGGDYRDREFAGVCFSPRGDYLFVNVQVPGVTFAITGPWERGPL